MADGSETIEAGRISELLDRMEACVIEIDALDDPVRATVHELLDGLDTVHRLALGRLASALGDEEVHRLRQDPAVGWLLSAYGVVPTSCRRRGPHSSRSGPTSSHTAARSRCSTFATAPFVSGAARSPRLRPVLGRTEPMELDQLRKRLAGPSTATVRDDKGGIGRASSPEAEEVSDDRRRRTGPFLNRRRQVAALSLMASGAMGAVAAYQNGLISHLPEPPLPLLDADEVDASGEAYQLFKTPDAALGLAALTLVLAGAGSAGRAEERPWLPLTMAAKVAGDALGGLYLTAEQASKHRRFCSWCLVASAASVAMVPQVIPEARAALLQLRSKRN